VYTTTRVRAEVGVLPRYTLVAGLAQTFDWYQREGLDQREIDFAAEDAFLRTLGA
jgi:dTDP-D-glucose 4,6-dehydratase